MAILSTYLGHVDPANTYWYLSAAPELLGWPAIGLSATLEVTHDRTCHDSAGLLH